MASVLEQNLALIGQEMKSMKEEFKGYQVGLKEQKDAIEKLASNPIQKANSALPEGRQLLSFSQHNADQWPVDRLNRMMDAYAPFRSIEEVKMLGAYNGRQTQVSGIGPYLCKMAGMAAASVNHTQTLEILRQSGGWTPGYGVEQFTKEFEGAHPAVSPYVIKGWNGGEVRKAALAEGSGQTGGYTIPPQFMNELLTIAAEDGFIEKRAKVIPMNTRTAQWPMLDITAVQAAGTTPYFGGILAQWQPEAASINETEPAFKQTEWTAWDLVMYTVSSNQLLADNGIGLDALLTQLFGAAVTWYKEFAYINGLGSGATMPLGILNAPATISVTRNTAAKFQYPDVAGMMSHLQIRSWKDACWMMHQSVLPQIMQMVDHYTSGVADTGAHLIWVTPFGDGKTGGAAMGMPDVFFNGLPLFFSEKMPQLGVAGCVALADWSRYVIGMRLDLQIDVSPHFLFRNNQLAWRVIARADGKPWLNKYVTDQTGWQVSPFVYITQ